MLLEVGRAGSDGTLQNGRSRSAPALIRAGHRSMCKTGYPGLVAHLHADGGLSLGVTTKKAEYGCFVAGTLISDGRYDALYLRNRQHSGSRTERAPAVPSERFKFGSGEYAMRVWLDPGSSR